MSVYAIALFVHILGAVLLFAALTVEGIAIWLSAKAQNKDQVRIAASTRRLGAVVGPPSAVALLAPGLYMTATSWGLVPWIVVGLAAWTLIAIWGAVNGIRPTAVEREVGAESGTTPMELTARLRDPFGAVSWRIRAGMALGVLFLMTTKPGLAGAVLAVVAGAALGLAAGLPALARAPSARTART